MRTYLALMKIMFPAMYVDMYVCVCLCSDKPLLPSLQSYHNAILMLQQLTTKTCSPVKHLSLSLPFQKDTCAVSKSDLSVTTGKRQRCDFSWPRQTFSLTDCRFPQTYTYLHTYIYIQAYIYNKHSTLLFALTSPIFQ